MDELDFNKIVTGEEQAPSHEQIQAKEKKMTKTDTRDRQQSCMISDVDKDLVKIHIIVATEGHPAGQPRQLQSQPQWYAFDCTSAYIQDKNDEALEKYKKTLLG